MDGNEHGNGKQKGNDEMRHAWTLASLLAIATLTGCATQHDLGSLPPQYPGQVGDFENRVAICYEGPPEIEALVRAEMKRQVLATGVNAQGLQHCFVGVRLEPLGRNLDGWYGDLGNGDIVHGAYEGRQGAQWSTFWFAYPEGGSPFSDTVSHEVCHWTLIYNEGTGGHPETATIGGKEWNVHDIMSAGVRWPMLINAFNAVKRALTVWRKPGFSETVNGVYYGPEVSGFSEGGGI